MGDPAGVGPEVLIKSFKKARKEQNLVAISDFSKIRYLAERYNVRLRKINHINEAKNFKNYLNILHLDYAKDFYPGQFDVKNATSIIESLRIATDLCLKKKAGAMVTGPINKSILRSHNEFEFSGHTDYLEHLCGCKKDTALMMMLNKYLKIIFGLFASVTIYYLYNYFYVLGLTEKINIILSILLPLFILLIINSYFLRNINAK